MTRIFIAGFMHETNTFSNLPTNLDSYRARSLYLGDVVKKKSAGTKTEIAAFLDFCEDNNWEAICPIYADATPGGKVTEEAFNFVSSEILNSLNQFGPFDGVMLALHGAMVCEHIDDGEGELLKKIREQIGTEVPISVTLDLHANITDQMAEMSDIIVTYRTYPHIDQYEIAIEAADLLKRTLKRDIRPRCYVIRGQMLDGADHGRTTFPGPMTQALSVAKDLCEHKDVLSVSIAAGFPWVDILETGPSVVIVGDKDEQNFEALAQPIIDQLFEMRSVSSISSLSISNAMRETLEIKNNGKPIILSDFADNPGGGGYGDSINLLKGMIDAKIKNAAFGSIFDPSAVKVCLEQGLGANVIVSIGGNVDPKYGESLEVSGKVIAITDGKFKLEGPMMAGTPIEMGPTIVLNIAGIEVLITSGRFQVYDINFFKHARIDIFSKDVVAVKSAHHFRAAFEPISSRVIIVDTGQGLTSRNYRELTYKKVRRPVYPLDIS